MNLEQLTAALDTFENRLIALENKCQHDFHQGEGKFDAVIFCCKCGETRRLGESPAVAGFARE